MPLSYRIDPRRRVVHERATGVVTAADMKETLNRRLHDPQYHADMPVLSDYLEGTFRAATPELLLVADILLGRKSRLAGARWAFFTQDNLSFGLLRMLQVFTAGSEIQLMVFRDRAAASDWLNLPPAIDGEDRTGALQAGSGGN